MDHLPPHFKLFCPRRDCPCYQSLDNHITKDGTYTTQNDGVVRQMFNCGKGKHRFSETGYCELFGKHGSFKGKRSIFGIIHNTQPVMSDYPEDNFFGITDGIDRKNTRSQFLETSPRTMAGIWVIPGKLLSTAGIAPTPV